MKKSRLALSVGALVALAAVSSLSFAGVQTSVTMDQAKAPEAFKIAVVQRCAAPVIAQSANADNMAKKEAAQEKAINTAAREEAVNIGTMIVASLKLAVLQYDYALTSSIPDGNGYMAHQKAVGVADVTAKNGQYADALYVVGAAPLANNAASIVAT